MVQNDNLQAYQDALREFREKSDSSAADSSLDKRLEDSLYGYLAYVAQSGRPAFDWSIVQPFILAQVDKVIEGMCTTVTPGSPELSDVVRMKYRVMKRLSDFEAAPFTIQRLCELLLKPNEHYKRIDKFMRALEKTVHVVSTVDIDGRRDTEGDNAELNGSIDWLTDVYQEEEEENENDSDDTRPADIHSIYSERKSSISLAISPTIATSATSPMPSIEALWQSTLTSGGEMAASSDFERIPESEADALKENFAASSSVADGNEHVNSDMLFSAQPGQNECDTTFRSNISVEKLEEQSEPTVLAPDVQSSSSSHAPAVPQNRIGTSDSPGGISEGETGNRLTSTSAARSTKEEPLEREEERYDLEPPRKKGRDLQEPE